MQSTSSCRDRDVVHELAGAELLTGEPQLRSERMRCTPSSTPLWTARQPARGIETPVRTAVIDAASLRLSGAVWDATDQCCCTSDRAGPIDGGDRRAWSNDACRDQDPHRDPRQQRRRVLYRLWPHRRPASSRAGERFVDRATARNAARASEQYRSALRCYDPQVPYYNLIVCQDTELITDSTQRSRQDDHQKTPSDPVLDRRSTTVERQGRVEFCHRVAGAVFETLSEGGYDAIERAVMDAYFELAETVDDPDELCLYLLESMSTELDDRLEASEQADVLTGAATRSGPLDTTEKPLDATLSHLQTRGLIGGVTRSPWSVDLDGGARLIVVQLSDYALSPREGRLPVLPLVVELYRRQPPQRPTALRVAERGDGWRCTFGLTKAARPTGLVSTPIDSEV